MKHDVIVCVHNALQDLRQCLSALDRHWTSEGLNELIVIDDASDGETRAYLDLFVKKRKFARAIRLGKRHYYCRAANIGLVSTNAEVRTLLNSDTIVTRGWARSIRRALFSYPTVGVVGVLSNAASTQSVPFVQSAGDQTAINAIPPGVTLQEFADFVTSKGRDVPIPLVPLVHGFCYTITSDTISAVGLFDEETFPDGYGEENDYSFRAEDRGFLLAIATDAFVFHAKSRSYSPDDRGRLMRGSMSALAGKHGVRRIKSAVQFMEANPYLALLREAVRKNWVDHYGHPERHDFPPGDISHASERGLPR